MRKKYIYSFTWIDENGEYCGWNDVQADSMGEARKLARKDETKAGWRLYNGTTYVPIPEEVTGQGYCFRNKGMYINPKSFKRISVEKWFDQHRMADMMSR